MKRLCQKISVVIPGLLLLTSGFGAANESLKQLLFPPELIMRRQRDLELTPDQSRLIVEEIQSVQTEFTALQWDLEKEVQLLTSMVSKTEVSEEALLEQFDKVLELEREIKRIQLVLSVRIIRTLNRKQLEKLERIQRPSAGERGGSRNPQPQRQRSQE